MTQTTDADRERATAVVRELNQHNLLASQTGRITAVALINDRFAAIRAEQKRECAEKVALHIPVVASVYGPDSIAVKAIRDIRDAILAETGTEQASD